MLCYNHSMTELEKYRGMKICVAVSGGRDSMALLHYLNNRAAEYGITLSALNCDHGIRGERSALDSEFVREWCSEHKIPLIFFRCNCVLKTEAEARAWRKERYAEALERTSADAVATAHHLNDNAETVLFNLARGTALSGMEGITDGRKIIRPLIGVSREEIDGYIKENGVPFVEDETNLTDDYTRNKIRHNVLPELEKAVPGAAKAIYRFSRLAADDEEYFDKLIKERGLIKKTHLGCEIALCSEKVVFKRAVIKALVDCDIKNYTSEHAQMLYELQFAHNGKKFEFLGFTAFKEEGKIAICDSDLFRSDVEGISFKDHLSLQHCFWNGEFISVNGEKEHEAHLCAYEAAAEDDERIPAKLKVLKFDGDKIPEKAIIRNMREGDRFTKFGGGTKNLGDYFTDKKIPVRIRKRIPVVAEGSEVLLVGGVEISDKVKITDKTKNILYLICADYGA